MENMNPVSIPLRYADNQPSTTSVISALAVSIPLRYADNFFSYSRCKAIAKFQFLLGTLITRCRWYSCRFYVGFNSS